MTAAGYRTLLRTPGAAAFFLPTAAGRLGLAMTSLSIVWLVRAGTGSYATAGLVTGAFAAADALAGPQVGRLIDRYGQTRVLPPALLAHALAVAAVVATALDDGPAWLLTAGGALVGATLPQFSAAAAARWSALLDGSRRPALPTAYALESLSNNVAYLVGPALVSTVAASGRPVLGTLSAATLTVSGGLLLAAQRRTAPTVTAGATEHRRIRRALLRTDFAVLVGVNATIGAFFGTMSIAVTAFAVERGTPGMAAALFGASNGTGLIAVVIYGRCAVRRPGGARHGPVGDGLRLRRTEPGLQLTAWTAALGIGSLPLLAHDWVPAVTAGVVLTALAVPVVLMIDSLLAAATVDRAVLTEAFAWLGSASAAGSAAGAAAAGQAVDAVGARGGLLAAVVAAGAAAVLGLAGIRGRVGRGR
jgi:MFS family permease